MQQSMKWETLPVSALKPASYNPRKKLKKGDKEYEKIKKSLEEFGYVDPIIVNADHTVIGGHQRLTVLSDLGWTEVSVDIDKDREKALNIALNKITGTWDEALLADLLQDIQSSCIDTSRLPPLPALNRRKWNSSSTAFARRT